MQKCYPPYQTDCQFNNIYISILIYSKPVNKKLHQLLLEVSQPKQQKRLEFDDVVRL